MRGMLTFQRIPLTPGSFVASDDTRRYRVIKETGTLARTVSRWRLEILELVTTAGRTRVGELVVSRGFETCGLAKATANAYSELGDDCEPRQRLSGALNRAYDS